MAYQQTLGKLWPGMCLRVAAFAGAGILYTLSKQSQIDLTSSENELLAIASDLLSKGLHADKYTDRILFDAVVG